MLADLFLCYSLRVVCYISFSLEPRLRRKENVYLYINDKHVDTKDPIPYHQILLSFWFFMTIYSFLNFFSGILLPFLCFVLFGFFMLICCQFICVCFHVVLWVSPSFSLLLLGHFSHTPFRFRYFSFSLSLFNLLFSAFFYLFSQTNFLVLFFDSSFLPASSTCRSISIEIISAILGITDFLRGDHLLVLSKFLLSIFLPFIYFPRRFFPILVFLTILLPSVFLPPIVFFHLSRVLVCLLLHSLFRLFH